MRVQPSKARSSSLRMPITTKLWPVPEEATISRAHQVGRLAIGVWRGVCVMKDDLHIILGDITHAIFIIG
jgi:hypothetical protein